LFLKVFADGTDAESVGISLLKVALFTLSPLAFLGLPSALLKLLLPAFSLLAVEFETLHTWFLWSLRWKHATKNPACKGNACILNTILKNQYLSPYIPFIISSLGCARSTICACTAYIAILTCIIEQ
jgi:hypothetical protein